MGKISIQGLTFNGRKITNNIVVSKDLKRFIISPKMFVEFDDDIFANDSILNIPIFARVLPRARK